MVHDVMQKDEEFVLSDSWEVPVEELERAGENVVTGRLSKEFLHRPEVSGLILADVDAEGLEQRQSG